MDLRESEQEKLNVESGLSEEVIKKVALPFLKGHYKFRSDLMQSDLEAGNLLESSYDLKTQEGYIIDGYIAFRQRTGGKFVATFEATSLNKKEELYFKILYPLLVWDGLALSSILLTFLLTLSYGLQLFDFKAVGFALLLVGSLFCLSLLTLAFRFIFSEWYKGIDRYHYIYAIEQFKRYRANEKWIIFGEDVFQTLDDPYFVELRDQCTKGGFGLVKVTGDLKAIKILTPARTNLTNGGRMLDFITQNEFSKSISKSPFAPTLKRYFKRRLRRVERFTYLKFRRSYLAQMLIFALSTLLIASIFFKIFQEPEIVYESEADYEKKLKQREYIARNDVEFTPDSLDQQFIQAIDTSVDNYLNLPLEERPNYILKQRKVRNVTFDSFVPPPSNSADSRPRNYGIYILADGKVSARISCQRIAGTKTQYLVQESIHADSNAAFQRVNTLMERDVNANVFWTGCSNVQRDSYAVFLDMFFDTFYVAQIQVNVSKKSLESKGLISNVRLRPIKISQ